MVGSRPDRWQTYFVTGSFNSWLNLPHRKFPATSHSDWMSVSWPRSRETEERKTNTTDRAYNRIMFSFSKQLTSPGYQTSVSFISANSSSKIFTTITSRYTRTSKEAQIITTPEDVWSDGKTVNKVEAHYRLGLSTRLNAFTEPRGELVRMEQNDPTSQNGVWLRAVRWKTADKIPQSG